MPRGVYNRAKKTEIKKTEEVVPAEPKRRGRPPKIAGGVKKEELTKATFKSPEELPKLKKATEGYQVGSSPMTGILSGLRDLAEVNALQGAVDSLTHISQCAHQNNNNLLANTADAVLLKIVAKMDTGLFPVSTAQVGEPASEVEEKEEAAEGYVAQAAPTEVPDPIVPAPLVPAIPPTANFTPVAQPTVPVAFNPPTVQ